MSREYTLRNCLSSIKDDHDYILLDCQPSLGMLAINALAIANTTFKILNTDTNQYVVQMQNFSILIFAFTETLLLDTQPSI